MERDGGAVSQGGIAAREGERCQEDADKRSSQEDYCHQVNESVKYNPYNLYNN